MFNRLRRFTRRLLRRRVYVMTFYGPIPPTKAEITLIPGDLWFKTPMNELSYYKSRRAGWTPVGKYHA